MGDCAKGSLTDSKGISSIGSGRLKHSMILFIRTVRDGHHSDWPLFNYDAFMVVERSAPNNRTETIMFKTQEIKSQSIRALSNDELDVVTGGAVDSFHPQTTIAGSFPSGDWTFKDVFAKHGIGH